MPRLNSSKPKRALHATASLTSTPPPILPSNQSIARIVHATGNNVYLVLLPITHENHDPSANANTNADADADAKTGTTLDADKTSNSNPEHEQTNEKKHQILVEMPAKFRSTIWVRRGSYVVVDFSGAEERSNKLGGEIVNVVREEREWRSMGYWPKEFAKKPSMDDDESDEESTVGKMPPSDSEEEDGE